MMPTKFENGKKTIQRAWHGWKNNRKHIQQKAVALVLLMFMLVTATTGAMAANGTTDDEGNASDYSFATMSSTASGALSTAMGDADNAADAVSSQFGKVTASSAGGLLGFTELD